MRTTSTRTRTRTVVRVSAALAGLSLAAGGGWMIGHDAGADSVDPVVIERSDHDSCDSLADSMADVSADMLTHLDVTGELDQGAADALGIMARDHITYC